LGFADCFIGIADFASDLMLTLEQRKRLFAEQYMATPQEIYKAGTAAWPDKPSEGLRVALEWVNDPEVIKYCNELRTAGISPNVPPKEQVVKELLDIGRDVRAEAADRIKAFELASKIMGYIVPAQTNIKHTTVTDNRVMVVRDHGSPDEWEAKAQLQQKRLIEGHAIRDEDTTSRH
jgi:hypothetical protein